MQSSGFLGLGVLAWGPVDLSVGFGVWGSKLLQRQLIIDLRNFGVRA